MRAAQELAVGDDTPVCAARNRSEHLNYSVDHDYTGCACAVRNAVRQRHIPPHERAVVLDREQSMLRATQPASDVLHFNIWESAS